MSTVLQVAAAASRQIAHAQAAVTNNLANAGTTAFKADLFYAEQGYARSGEAGASAVDFKAGNIPTPDVTWTSPLPAMDGCALLRPAARKS